MYILLLKLLLFWMGSVSSQTVGICTTTVDCSGGSDVGIMTMDECCLGTTNGLAFITGEVCTPCIGM